ncbi:MAG: SRPBCC domain-containing protein [Lapillicoccus sp.]
MTNDGRLDASRGRIEFTRDHGHPRRRVWEVLTTPQYRAAWFFPGTLEPHEGGLVELTESGPGITGRVTAVEKDSLLRMDWDSLEGPHSAVSFELADHHDDGTRMRFVHHINPDCRPASLLAGWHRILDSLTAHLDGTEPPTALHADLLERYQRRDGAGT